MACSPRSRPPLPRAALWTRLRWRHNITRWETTGLSGYVVAGSNGESVLLEDDEIIEAVRVVRQAAGTGKLVIAGVGKQSTRATIELTRKAAGAGAQYALVMTPSFYAVETTPRRCSATMSPSPRRLPRCPCWCTTSPSSRT